MSVNIDRIPDAFRPYGSEDDGRPEWVLNETMTIWIVREMTRVVGLRYITEENFKDFFIRVSMYERVWGAGCRILDPEDSSKLIDRPVTLADVRQYIGLQVSGRHSASATEVPAQEFGPNDEFWWQLTDLVGSGPSTQIKAMQEGNFPTDWQDRPVLPVEPAYGSNAEFALQLFEGWRQEISYRLSKGLRLPGQEVEEVLETAQ